MEKSKVKYNQKALCAIVKNGHVEYCIEYSINGQIVFTEQIDYNDYVKMQNAFDEVAAKNI